MKKKFLSIVLVATMVASVFAGCGNKNNNNNNSSNANANANAEDDKATDEDADGGETADSTEIKPFEATMLYSDNANYPYNKDWFVWDVIKEHTGASFKVTAVPESDYPDKTQVIFNSGDIPDVVTKTFVKSTDAMAGLFLPIDEYEDKMPNYKAWIEKSGCRDELDRTRMGDGHYYTFPTGCNDTKMQDHVWLIRTDIFEKNNIPVPTTMEQVYEAGKKLKEIYPDSNPITNRFGSGNLMAGIASGFGTIAGWTIGDCSYYNKDTDSYEFAPTTDKWKAMLEYTAKLYKDGVLDPEFGTLDSTVYEQKIVQGSTFIMYDWAGNALRYNQDGVNNDPDFHVAPIMCPEGQDGHYPLQWTNTWSMGTALAASAKDKPYFDQLLAYIDWCFTDEAATLLSFGSEDMYEVINGVKARKDDSIDYCAEYGVNNNALLWRKDPDLFFTPWARTDDLEEVKGVFNQMTENNCVPEPNPGTPLSADKIEELSVTSTTLTDYANQMMESFIFGKESLDKWDKFVSECEKKGSKKLIDAYNEAWANRAK